MAAPNLPGDHEPVYHIVDAVTAGARAGQNQNNMRNLGRSVRTMQHASTCEDVYQVVAAFARTMDCHALVLERCDDDSLAVAHIGLDQDRPGEIEALRRQVPGLALPLPVDATFERVITAEEVVFEPTADLVTRCLPELDRDRVEDLVVQLGLRRSILAPVHVDGAVEAALVVAGDELSGNDVPSIRFLADQMGIALEHVRLSQQVSTAQEGLRRLAREVIVTQEKERTRLSRVLHDQAGQALIALKVHLELIKEDLPPELALLRQRMTDAIALTDETMEEIRTLARNLRPPALDAVGLGPALEGLCQDVAHRTGLDIDYSAMGQAAMSEEVSICLYRCLQEALTNVVKHATASQVSVALRCTERLARLSVEDDGRGFDSEARLSAAGWAMGIGLAGLQDRVDALGGQLEICSRPGEGTRIEVTIPVCEVRGS
ncbi:MAG: sensor histidine kinase [Anaerolineae bacterium]|nr:sensor histidine kinase [Anaerolineae bacterium]